MAKKITHYIASETLTQRQWLALGWLLHKTTDKMEWAFVCPACDRVWTVRQFKDLGQDVDLAYQQCINRQESLKHRGKKPRGSCDWAAYGLFGGPWIVVLDKEKSAEGEPAKDQGNVMVFPFARATKELVEQARREVDTIYAEAKAYQTAQEIAKKAGV